MSSVAVGGELVEDDFSQLEKQDPIYQEPENYSGEGEQDVASQSQKNLTGEQENCLGAGEQDIASLLQDNHRLQSKDQCEI